MMSSRLVLYLDLASNARNVGAEETDGFCSLSMKFPSHQWFVSTRFLHGFRPLKGVSTFPGVRCADWKLTAHEPLMASLLSAFGGKSARPSFLMRPKLAALVAHLLIVPLGLPMRSAMSVTLSIPSRTC